MEDNELIRVQAHITLGAAEAAIRAGLQKAEELGVRISIVVVDANGFFVAGVRMDGCGAKADEAAIGKARFGVNQKVSTADFIENRLKNNEALWRAMANRHDIWPVQGGYPMKYKGRNVGGVGVSGALHEQDSQVAEAAAQHFADASERVPA